MEEKIVRVDVAKQQVTMESVPSGWEKLGGRGLIPRILLDESDPACDPLGPFSKLIWAPGLLVGHMLSSSDRISVGGKSPLTGGIKESNAGGTTGLRLINLGIKALIIEGSPTREDLQILLLNREGGTFTSAGDLAGLGAYAAGAKLVERYGPKQGYILIGPGGEMQLRSAGIINLDKDREPSRINARGGMGAVMGAKGLKAIVIDDTGGQKPPLHDLELYKAAQKYYTKELLAHPQRQRRLLSHLDCNFTDLYSKAFAGEHSVQQAEFTCLFCVDTLTGQDELFGLCQTDQPWKPGRSSGVRQNAEVNFRQREGGIIHRIPQVTAQCKLQPPSKRRTVQRCNGHLLNILELAENPVPVLPLSDPEGLRLQRLQYGEVGPGAEVSAFPFEENDTDIVIDHDVLEKGP